MYESFFGLRDKPFNMTPDPRFLYLSDSHEEALSALLYGIQEKKGLITLTGPVGVGKTTILYSFFEQMRDRIEIAFFPGGFSSTRVDFLKELCRLFRLRTDADSQFDLTREIEGFLRDRAKVGKNIVLLADEAQELSLEELNHFRFLNNLETPDVKFLQVILCGTGELDERLRDPRILSLRQRVAIRCVLNPLDARSSVAYIHHRVQVAGGSAADLFTPGAIWRIVSYARGIPRLINVVSDNALVIAFALKKHAVEEGFVREALESVEGDESAREPSGFVSREEVAAFCFEVRAGCGGRRETRHASAGVQAAPGPAGANSGGSGARGSLGSPAAPASPPAAAPASSSPRLPDPEDHSVSQAEPGPEALPFEDGREASSAASGVSATPSAAPAVGMRPSGAVAPASSPSAEPTPGAAPVGGAPVPLPAGQSQRRAFSLAVFLLAGLLIGALGSYLFLKSAGPGRGVGVFPAEPETDPARPGGTGRQSQGQPMAMGDSPLGVTPSSGLERAGPGTPGAEMGTPASGQERAPAPEPAAREEAPAVPTLPGLTGSRQGAEDPAAGTPTTRVPSGQPPPSAPTPGTTVVQRAVKAGEGIAAILQGQYHRLDPRDYAEVRRLNPGIQDLNRLQPGAPLRLPAGALPGGGDGEPGEFYTIQAVTFASQGHVDRVVAGFCDQGLQNVFVATAPGEDKPTAAWVCCYAGLFGAAEEALTWVEEVRRWGFRDAFVTRLRAVRLEEGLRGCGDPATAQPARGGR